MSLTSFITFSIFTLGVVIGLLWLGGWQVDRGSEKRELVRLVNERVLAPPLQIEDVERRWVENGDIEFLRVEVKGQFDHGGERYFFATFDGQKGWHVYTPFKLKNGRLLMVNRGFVSDEMQSPKQRQSGQIVGETVIVGLVRKPGKKGYFDPENDLVGNVWYWRDLSNMVASVYDKMKVSAYPFFVEVEADTGLKSQSKPVTNSVLGQSSGAVTSKWPRPGVTRITFRDNHLQYAMTWYGLAIVLFAVYGFFLRTWLKQRQAG